jgi:hypothetical protein
MNAYYGTQAIITTWIKYGSHAQDFGYGFSELQRFNLNMSNVFFVC